MPKVSILMKCYNHEKWVGEAIESVLQQTYTDFEFLIVENGCTDHSYDVIMKYQDPRIKVFRLEKNNPEEANKLLLREQKGEYIADIHSDDIWMKNKLEKQMNFFEKNPKYQIVFTWAFFTDQNLQVIEGQKNTFIRTGRSRLEWIRELLENGNCFAASSVIVKKEVRFDFAPLELSYHQLGDLIIWLKYLQKLDIGMVEEILVKMRMHGNNISSPTREVQIRTDEEMSEIIYTTIEDMTDYDFIETYYDKLIHKDINSHIEILCEKYFLLLDYSKSRTWLGSKVCHYFYKYYVYEENGITVAHVLREKYNYQKSDFNNYNKDYSHAASLRREIEYKFKLRNRLTQCEKDVINDICSKIEKCIVDIQSENHSVQTLKVIFNCISNIIDNWNGLEDLGISISEEEISLCSVLCQQYSEHPEQTNWEFLIGRLIRYEKEIKKILL